ncbi:general stress protein [Paludifilum halophilum]|uniref:General stress protein n=1 Tax=Paludifilum halophilum TaxID=1642702 RepID=A0A235BA46_9BACL|nr:general stress protein [Paludifilum halophilum]
MAQWNEITTFNEWNQAFQQSEERPVLVMKHSTRCPVSADAWEECKKYTEDQPRSDMDYVIVKVLESREVSDRIAEDLGVKHQSPQTILLKNGKPVWHTSHWHIKKEALEEVLASHLR